MLNMKTEQENKNNTGSEKNINKKVDTTFKAVIVGLTAIFLLNNIYYIVPFLPFLLFVILYVTLILCISAVLFTFIKPRAWLYKVIGVVVGLYAGISFFPYLDSMWFWDTPYFLFTLLNQIEDPHLCTFLYYLILTSVCLIYAAAIFATALLVQYIYKRIKKKMVSTP